ncbi:hypothetical protein MOQ_004123 [Trypanosoma cruzi marinkellei]|uniref:C2HC/C3H-type domain-containing protein n=1 Tax=Trypanosoma cruzi marinkellei TaxID=85056 RepID=K2MAA9_TRYCR|nr:hypothetical protein MOQ_004123 [Trypanosoma cruzi marinkellei]
MQDKLTLHVNHCNQSNAATSNSAGANGSSWSLGRLFDSEATDLLREQREFLAKAPANEIRASIFLRLRLSAQQKLVAQRNRFSERWALQNKRRSSAVPSVMARTPSAAEPPEDVNSNPEEEEEREEGWQCRGCLRNYNDVSAFTRHRNHCAKYILLKKKHVVDTVSLPASSSHVGMKSRQLFSTSSVGSTFKAEVEFSKQRLDSAGIGLPRADAFNTCGGSSVLNASDLSHSEQTRRNTAFGSDAALPGTFSLPAENKSANRSPSIHCFSTLEERRDERMEEDGRKDAAPVLSLSRELTPFSSEMLSQPKISPSGRASIDDLPAAVADRVSFEKAASLPMWVSLGGTAKFGEDGNSTAGKNQRSPSFAQSKATFNGSSVSGTKMQEETDGMDEPLRPCPHCGRQFFAETRWPRHVAVCEQQQQQQRQRKSQTESSRSVQKLTSLRASRSINMGSTNFSDSFQDALQTPSSNRGKAGNAATSAAEKKSSKWRQQRAQLRQALQLGSARSQNNSLKSGGDVDVFEDDRVTCPACGRRFAPATAERHIPFCQERRSGPKTMRI